jgi:hypothetical protein
MPSPVDRLLDHSNAVAPIAPEANAPTLIAMVVRSGQEAGTLAPDLDVDAVSSLLFHALHGATDDITAGADRGRTVAALERLTRSALIA